MCGGESFIRGEEGKGRGREGNEDVPTSDNQTNSNLTIANIASPTHNPGCAYSANQKNRRSVAFWPSALPAPPAPVPRS